MEIRSRYSPRLQVAIFIDEKEKRTKGSFADACDINKIMDRYKRTGLLPSLVKAQPQYGDFADVPDYQTALELVRRSETSFAALPAEVRAQCNNDPAVFLAAVNDPAFVEKNSLALTGKEPPRKPSNPQPEAPKGAPEGAPKPPTGGT